MSTEQTWDEYYQRLRDSFELPEEEQEKLYDEFLGFVRSRQDEFTNRLRDIPGTEDGLIFNILMTLAKDPNAWKSQLVNLLERLFDEVKRGSDPKRIFKAMEGFKGLPSHKFDRYLAEELIESVYREFDAEDREVRRMAVDLMGSFMKPGDTRCMERLARMTSDSYWKVRVLATWAINESKNVPHNNGLSLFDRLRLMLGSVA